MIILFFPLSITCFLLSAKFFITRISSKTPMGVRVGVIGAYCASAYIVLFLSHNLLFSMPINDLGLILISLVSLVSLLFYIGGDKRRRA